MDPDPGGPKTYRSDGTATLLFTMYTLYSVHTVHIYIQEHKEKRAVQRSEGM
jgi:hypothetical protein